MMTTQTSALTSEPDELALPRQFGKLCKERATGVLVVTHERSRCRLFFISGRPSGIVASAQASPFGAFLVSRGLIEKADLERSAAHMARFGTSQARSFVELGLLSMQDLAAHQSEHAISGIVTVLEKRGASFEFNSNAQMPSGTEGNLVDPFSVLFSLFDRSEEVDRVGVMLRWFGDARLAPTPDGRLLTDLDLGEDGRAVFERLQGGSQAVDLLARSSLEMQRAGAILASLWCLGLVSADREELSPAAGVGEPAPARHSPTTSVASTRADDRPSPGSGEAAPARPSRSTKSDSDLKARRSRLLKRAFKNIPGGVAPKGGQRAAGPPPSSPKDAPSRPVASSDDKPTSTPTPRTPAPKNGEEKKKQALVEEVATLSRVIDKQDFYKRLGVTKASSDAEIKAAYLSRVKRFHPDRAGGLGLAEDEAKGLHKIFEAMQEAYEKLRDPKLRKQYEEDSGAAKSSDERQKERALAKAEINFKKGEGLFKKKDYARALEYLDAALEVDPQNGGWLTLQAWAKYNVGPKEAVKEDVRRRLLRAASVDESKALASYYLGILARLEGKLQWAERHVKDAVDPGCKLPEAAAELREARRKLGKDTASQAKSLLKRVWRKG